MLLKFYKYQGTGNDFIILDDMSGQVDIEKLPVKFLCDRKFGIGADGLMTISPADNKTDFLMRYYNADGNISSMCGNGGRCIASFAASHKYVGGETNFMAIDGSHKAIIRGADNSLVQLQMGNVKKPELHGNDVVLDTGSPHYVKFVSSVEKINVIEEGRRIRYNHMFSQKGINVNFVEVQGDHLYIRTYERGVEDETLSCGTGVTASVIAAAFTNQIPLTGRQKVKTPGGILYVQYEKEGDGFINVWLEGEATFVFEGEINI